MAKKEQVIQKKIRVTFEVMVEHEPGAVLNQDDLIDTFIDLFDTSTMRENILYSQEDFAGEVTSIELKNLSILQVRK